MHCVCPGDYHCLSLTHVQFHPPKVTPLTNLSEGTVQRLCYYNSNAWGWQNSHQSGVVGLTDQLIFHEEKSSDVYRGNNNSPKTLPRGTPDTTLSCLLKQPSTITSCDRFDGRCVNTVNTEHPTPTE